MCLWLRRLHIPITGNIFNETENSVGCFFCHGFTAGRCRGMCCGLILRTFYASQSCPAYQSKNKKTNPGNIYLVSGQSYQIRRANKNNASWYRVVVSGANPQLRWVSADCGEVKGSSSDSSGSSGSGSSGSGNSCSTAGLEDSYVFALSWQPAFCETHSSKPECKVTDADAYQAGNFTLHGLW